MEYKVQRFNPSVIQIFVKSNHEYPCANHHNVITRHHRVWMRLPEIMDSVTNSTKSNRLT